jgi:hypothetical protein
MTASGSGSFLDAAKANHRLREALRGAAAWALGGAVKSHLYDVLSVLYLDLQQSSEWEQRRRVIRASHMGDGRRMCFKSLNDQRRQEALIPFLDAANSIYGLALSIAGKVLQLA